MTSIDLIADFRAAPKQSLTFELSGCEAVRSNEGLGRTFAQHCSFGNSLLR